MANIKSRIAKLEKYKDKAPLYNVNRIDNIIDFYETRRIANYKTAYNAVKLLSSVNKHTVDSNKAIKK